MGVVMGRSLERSLYVPLGVEAPEPERLTCGLPFGRLRVLTVLRELSREERREYAGGGYDGYGYNGLFVGDRAQVFGFVLREGGGGGNPGAAGGCVTAGRESSSAMTGIRPASITAVREAEGESGDFGMVFCFLTTRSEGRGGGSFLCNQAFFDGNDNCSGGFFVLCCMSWTSELCVRREAESGRDCNVVTLLSCVSCYGIWMTWGLWLGEGVIDEM